MEITFICYPNCTTCMKAKKWLDDNGIKYDFRDIKLDNPNSEELACWYKKSGLPIKRFFNTSGLLYKEQHIKEKIDKLSEKELIDILASNGMMVKRPLLITENAVLVGFKEAEWTNCFRLE